MKHTASIIIISLTAVITGIFSLLSDRDSERTVRPLEPAIESPRTSGAGIAMDAWVFERAYPHGNIPSSAYLKAFDEVAEKRSAQRSVDGEWESMGPENVGGRTLCLAFHPTDTNTIYAGSASGGLWKSTTRGIGRFAWIPVPTGHPVSAVASIAIDPEDPDVMYIGTGETYGGGVSQPGIVNRYTRGTYGIGILKTTDGGLSWSQSLAFEVDEIKGVQDVVLSPIDSDIVFAATSDGVYRSTDAGVSWTLVLDVPDCFDIEAHPTDIDIVYVSQGNLNNDLIPSQCGIYKSTDGGASFEELMDTGLASAWSGNAKLTLDPQDPETIYADIQVGWFNTDNTTPVGLYRSTDAGENWQNINNQNIAQWQGWYSHDMAIHPTNSDEMMYVGIDAWRSVDGGTSFLKESQWTQWEFGVLDVEVPEGGPNYVHADIHAVYYHPLAPDEVYLATDGGVFGSYNGGISYTTLNGGLQTTQFYADMGSSATDPGKAICGAQDNATYIYEGTPSWRRVIGGDGMCAAIDQSDDQVIFGSYQNLNILRSTNGGLNFYSAGPTLLAGEAVAFNGPFVMAPSDSDVLYAGAQYLYRSESSGDFWEETASEPVDGDNVIIAIEVSASDPEVLLVATSPVNPFNGDAGAKVLLSTDGGESFDQMQGLPDRICKDMAFDPEDSDIAYAVFSGFGTGHVYKTTDGGDTWFMSDLGLPDLPTNTIVVDPNMPDHVYVGNDLSVYFSSDAGGTWDIWDAGLPEATIMMHLDISPSNNRIRIATHGRGLYERDLQESAIGVDELVSEGKHLVLYPNPVQDRAWLEIDCIQSSDNSSILLLDDKGARVMECYTGPLQVGHNQIELQGIEGVSAGTYYIQVIHRGAIATSTLIKMD